MPADADILYRQEVVVSQQVNDTSVYENNDQKKKVYSRLESLKERIKNNQLKKYDTTFSPHILENKKSLDLTQVPSWCLPPLYEAREDENGNIYEWTYSRGNGREECAYLYNNGQQIYHFPHARHIHNQYVFDGVLYLALGDYFHWIPQMKGRSRFVASYDGWQSFVTLEQHVRANYLAMIDHGGKLYLGEDSAQFSPSSRIIQYNPKDWSFIPVFTLPQHLRANIGSIQRYKEGYIIGTFVDMDGDSASIWWTIDFVDFALVHAEPVKAWEWFGPGTLQQDAIAFLKERYALEDA